MLAFMLFSGVNAIPDSFIAVLIRTRVDTQLL